MTKTKIVQIGEGAEAKVFFNSEVVEKVRFPKKYRISDIDEELRFSRTRREIKILEKLKKVGFKIPDVFKSREKDKVKMSFLKGQKVRDALNLGNYEQISKDIGQKLAKMHALEVIHGDLTTSNMIYGDEVTFIDFGLSFVSNKAEDKAVDLHLLKQALESYHFKVWEKSFELIISEYKRVLGKGAASIIIERLKVVEARGRNKH